MAAPMSVTAESLAPSRSTETETACFHCGLPVPPGASYAVVIDGHRRPMCCHGCEAVAEAIVAAGLTDFYHHRTTLSRRPEDLIPEALRGLELYDRPDLQKSFVRVDGEHTREAALILEGIVCAACVWLNDEVVWQDTGQSSWQLGEGYRRVRFRKGFNTILVRIENGPAHCIWSVVLCPPEVLGK